MNAMTYLVTVLFNLYLMVVLLRFALQLVRADFYNPFSQFVVKATHPILAPMRRLIPSVGRLDLSTLVLALLVGCGKWIAVLALNSQPLNPMDILLLGGLTVLKEAGVLLFWILLIRAILSWVSQGYNPFEAVLHQLTEPLLAPIRRVIPPMGGLDLSMLVLLLGMNFINLLIGDLIPLWRLV